MATVRPDRCFGVAAMKNWNGDASLTFRLWLSVKASDLREAVLSGETTEDDIVLLIADDLERMAMGMNVSGEPALSAPYGTMLA